MTDDRCVFREMGNGEHVFGDTDNASITDVMGFGRSRCIFGNLPGLVVEWSGRCRKKPGKCLKTFRVFYFPFYIKHFPKL